MLIRSANFSAVGSTRKQKGDMNKSGTQNAFERNADYILRACCSFTTPATGTWNGVHKKNCGNTAANVSFTLITAITREFGRLFRNGAAWFGQNLLAFCFRNRRSVNLYQSARLQISKDFTIWIKFGITKMISAISLRRKAFWACIS